LNTLNTQFQLFKPSRSDLELQMLSFLAQESWASDVNLCVLLQISRRTLLGVLRPMVVAKTIKSVLQKIMGGTVQLFGITSLGHKQLFRTQTTPSEFAQLVPKPNPLTARISPTFIPHRLDIQLLRIRAERAGWTNWVNADTGQKLNLEASVLSSNSRLNLRSNTNAQIQSEHRPDAWCTNPLGKRVCIECERTIKSKPRYATILCDYLLALKRGDFDGVIWVCPDLDLRDRLDNLITSITHVQISGLSVLIPRNRFEQFEFKTFEQWVT